jgi:glucosyl-3-phosphoglycerate phosphatase
MVELWFLRHGESVWNAAGLWQGQADPPLSERGRQQAERAAERLAGLGIGLLAASDLGRARATAEIAAARLGLPILLEPALRELDVGRWSGLAHGEIERRWPDELARFRAGDLALRAGGGESRLALRERVEDALRRLVAGARGSVAVVSHLGVLRALRPQASLGPGELVRLDPLAVRAPDGHNEESGRAIL